MEWMKFDPVKVGAEIEHLSLAAQGAYFRLMRHLWTVGPITEKEARRKCQGAFDELADLLTEEGDALSLQWLETLREEANKLSDKRSNVASDAKKKRAIAEQMVANGEQLPSNCLSISKSSSSSSSKSEEKERLRETFDAFWSIYKRKEGKKDAAHAWTKMTDAERQAATDKAAHFCSVRDPAFIPFPATYLNGRRWEDADPPKPTTPARSGPPQPMSLAEVRAEMNKIREAHGIAPGAFLPDELIPDWLHKAKLTAK